MVIKNWILDSAVPVVIEDNSASADFSFLRKMIVVIKGDDDLVIRTLAQNTTEEILKPLNGALDAGLTSVDFIIKEDLDLSTIELKGSYYTLVAVGFSQSEVSTKDLGNYDGVFIYNLATGVGGIEYNVGWVRDSDGYTSIFTYALLLANPEWKTIQYKSTNKNIQYVDNAVDRQAIYNAGGTAWGFDDVVGKRLVTMFINGKSAVKPYIYRELVTLLQQAGFNGMANGLYYTQGDANYVAIKGSDLIEKAYGDKLVGFEFNVKLDPTDKREFIGDLTIEVPETIWTINLKVKGV